MTDTGERTSEDFLLRPMGQDDRNYVLSSWLTDFQSSKWAKAVGGAYFKGHAQVVNTLLENCSTTLCVWRETPDFIIGWACTGPGARVHYVYVRASWRGKGIAKRLLAPFLGKPCQVTHAKSNKKLPEHWALNPYAIADV